MTLDKLALPSAPFVSRLDTPDADSWASTLASLSVVSSVECSSRDDRPGEISACRLIGGGLLALANCEPQLLNYRTISKPSVRESSISVLIALEGCGSIEQSERTFRYAAGDMVFRRSGVPARVNVEQKTQFLGLQMPMVRFFGAFTNYAKEFVPIRVEGDAPSAHAVKQYAETWLSTLGSVSSRSLFFAEQALTCLSTAAYYEAADKQKWQRPQGRTPAGCWERVLTALEAQICDPDLSADTLANAVGISKRYMHKLFEKNGLRYGQCVLQRRLEHARAELGDVTLTTLKVGEIAYRAGFNDAGHFSRSFRQMFAVAPSAYRESRLQRC